MVVEDLDGSMVVGHGSGSSTGSSGRQGGSFKSAFSSGQTGETAVLKKKITLCASSEVCLWSFQPRTPSG